MYVSQLSGGKMRDDIILANKHNKRVPTVFFCIEMVFDIVHSSVVRGNINIAPDLTFIDLV